MGPMLESRRDSVKPMRAKQAIRARGGKSPGGVSKNTYALVVGAEAGQTKLDKASDLGIPILGEIELRHLLQTGQLP